MRDRPMPAGIVNFIKKHVGKISPHYMAMLWNDGLPERSSKQVNGRQLVCWVEALGFDSKAPDTPEQRQFKRKRYLKQRGLNIRLARDRRKSARQQRLQLRDQFRAAHPNFPESRCRYCSESFPNTEQFFIRDSPTKLRTSRCRDCANDLQSTRNLASETERRLEAESKPARRLEAALKKNGERRACAMVELGNYAAKTPGKRCLKCHQEWPADVKFFQRVKLKDGVYLRRLCRFCEREYKLRLKYGPLIGIETAKIKRERQELYRQAFDEFREYRRLEAAAQSRREVGQKRRCSMCLDSFTLDRRHWSFRTSRSKREEPEVNGSRCKYCLEKVKARGNNGVEQGK